MRAAHAEPAAPDRLLAPHHTRDRISDPAVSRRGTRFSGHRGRPELDLDRRAAAHSLSAVRADVAQVGSASGGLDRLRVHQRRLPHGGLHHHADLGVTAVSAVAAASSGRAKLRAVGCGFLRRAALEASGCAHLRSGAADGADHGRRDRLGVHRHLHAEKRPGGIEPSGSARAGGGPPGDSTRARLRRRDHAGDRSRGRDAPRRSGAGKRRSRGGDLAVGHRRLHRRRRSHRDCPPDSCVPACGSGGTCLDRAAGPGARSEAAVRRPDRRVIVAPAAAIVLAVAALGGCRVGPNYHAPALPVKTETPLVSVDPSIETPAPPPDAAWRLYNDPRLDRLVQEALRANFNLVAADSNLAAARAVLDAVHASRYPSTEASAVGLYGRDAVTEEILELGGHPPQTTWLFEDVLQASYEVDIFGRVHRAIEAANANADAVVAARDSVRVVVVAETTRAYAAVCALGEELAAARHSFDVVSHEAQITAHRQEARASSEFDVARAEALAAQVRSAIAPLEC